ncbi:helix-turn-helix domain-containing protein [Kribbella shirazensis]|uniref:Transcriptional regulator with XRE-family HTH domain n=1 Tax=Kribbella shirazensis TaxID=1105143 RepID=A0A7X5ZYK1_9ACTN|nr:helix-turn-helix transcriptional regulator [Kribbella shirazensis]NIK55067.1 transcriptional regulator with XRE-family HTH domain [Kribbella shirazensis]
MELGEVLRERRKATGRTIASVAVDAGLSVPYIANLENGRGNPTIAALDRLATALGARLEVRIGEEEPPPASAAAELLATSDRAERVIGTLATGGRTRAAIRRDLIATVDSLAVVLGRPVAPADLNRLLDLLQLGLPA